MGDATATVSHTLAERSRTPAGRKQRRIVLPHEHGGWAMVSVPFALGVAAGQPTWLHAPLFAAWLCLYLASYPLLQSWKRRADRPRLLRWAAGYAAAAAVCAIAPIAAEPRLLVFGLPLGLLLAVNISYVRRRSERAFVNDLCAVLLFSLGGAAAYLLGAGVWDGGMAAVTFFSFLYFAGAVFFVKSVFRERMNRRWTIYAYAYHALLLLVPWAVGYPWMCLAYLFAAGRAFGFAGKEMRPMRVGLLEIAGSVLFLVLSAVTLAW